MSFPAYLRRAFEDRRRRNPRYSVRAFARDLGCDHATLSQWLRGKRPMSAGAVQQISAALDLDIEARSAAQAFDPFDMPVLEAIRAARHPDSPGIAAALGAPVDRVNIALHRLLRLGRLRMDGAAWIAAEEAPSR
jgi:transcriptional regulator with XRE-family HTH domain